MTATSNSGDSDHRRCPGLPPTAYAFITWDPARGRRMCPLATFGDRRPQVRTAPLVCVDPPRADREVLANAAAVRGAIALVVRGGCSFADKARRLAAAGAVAMILANNIRDAPFAMFTMADDADSRIAIPCVMMCLQDVRELFKQHPPTARTGVLTLEIHEPPRADELVAECERQRQQAMLAAATHDKASGSGGWGVLKRTTSLITRWELPPPGSPRDGGPEKAGDGPSSSPSLSSSSPAHNATTTIMTTTAPRPPLFAFVQWATSAAEYVSWFAPLSDFCLAANNAIYEGPRVMCDPPRADVEPLRNAEALRESIALVERGACTFPTKLERIQRCGAVAAIVGNDDDADPDAAFVMSVDQIPVDHVTIPSVMVSRNVFAQLTHERPERVRVLCLSGAAAAACLARNGQRQRIAPDVDGADEQDNVPGRGHRDEDDDDNDREDKTKDDPAAPTEDADLAALHRACRRGDHGAVQRLLPADESARRALVQTRDRRHRTALHHACAGPAANEHVVGLLLRLGASVHARDLTQLTPLHLACLRGREACVQRLLGATGAAPLAASPDLGGSTPLHYAARAGSTPCLELLLSSSAQAQGNGDYRFDGVDARDVDGATPLHVAVRHAHVDCVRYLVAANAALNVATRAPQETPLGLACALVNDPRVSLRALRIVERLMDAGAAVVDHAECDDDNDDDEDEGGGRGEDSPGLLLDRIDAKAVKRELEVAYLRHEAHAAQRRWRGTRRRFARHDAAAEALAAELQRVTAAHEDAVGRLTEHERRLERQQRQIGQLQVQVRTLLQVLEGTSAPLAHDVAGGRLRPGARGGASAPGSDEDRDDVEEETRAQEAALARDLGKKSCRRRQFDLAITYFERSLELYRLPGVRRLLDEARALQRAAATTTTTTIHHDSSTQRRRQRPDDRGRLEAAVGAMAATDGTKRAIRREIAKLGDLDPASSDYAAGVKWVEWLVALPWRREDDDDGQRDATPRNLDLEAAVFVELERLESERHGRQRHEAACRIQRAFRERYAVQLLRRAMASSRIQAAYRAARWRRQRPRPSRGGNLGASPSAVVVAPHGSPSTSTTTAAAAAVVDLAVTIDPAARRRLQSAGVTCRAPAVLLLQSAVTEDSGGFAVVQLLHGAPAGPFVVWRRWGPTRATARECVLSGPYDDRIVAEQRFGRARQEHRLPRPGAETTVFSASSSEPKAACPSPSHRTTRTHGLATAAAAAAS